MERITIKVCIRPCDFLLAKIFRLKHMFIIDKIGNIYEFSRCIEETKELTKWYLKNNPEKVKIKKIKVSKKLFYMAVRIQRRITRRRRYSIVNYNCYTYVNSILINLGKI